MNGEDKLGMDFFLEGKAIITLKGEEIEWRELQIEQFILNKRLEQFGSSQGTSGLILKEKQQTLRNGLASQGKVQKAIKIRCCKILEWQY